MEHSNIQAAVEAVLFASGEPVESEKLCEAVGIAKDQLEEALGSLADKYSKAESGITLLSLNGSYHKRRACDIHKGGFGDKEKLCS